eukprot:9521729-Heterocapsa_arctica.AAC.1
MDCSMWPSRLFMTTEWVSLLSWWVSRELLFQKLVLSAQYSRSQVSLAAWNSFTKLTSKKS